MKRNNAMWTGMFVALALACGSALAQDPPAWRAEFLQVEDYKNVLRWADAIDARPAVKRGRMVNRTSGEPSGQLHERHDAADFDKLPGRTELS